MAQCHELSCKETTHFKVLLRQKYAKWKLDKYYLKRLFSLKQMIVRNNVQFDDLHQTNEMSIIV